MTKKVLIIIAEESETVEIVAPADCLRRVGGIEVTIASVHGRDPVKTAADITIVPDAALTDVDKNGFDAVLMPGGFGYKTLAQSKLVGEILTSHFESGKLVCSICMSAHVLLAHEIGFGKKLTAYHYLTELLKEKYNFCEEDVVQDGNLITARGPGMVYAYSTKIIENLVGIEKAKACAEKNLVFGLY